MATPEARPESYPESEEGSKAQSDGKETFQP